MRNEINKRLAPFLALLDAKYAPLLFAVAPQAYSVYLWLFPKPYDSWGELFAVLGALGFEWVYVGAIAWAEEGKSSFWTWATAVVALVFSVLVAYYVHQSEGGWAWLHAGFPLVAFCYTINMYMATHHKQQPAIEVQGVVDTPQVAPQPAVDAPQLTTTPDVVTLPSLPSEAATIVRLKDGEGLSYNAIGKQLGKSGERIRQIYKQAKGATA